jgi:MFS family permease
VAIFKETRNPENKAGKDFFSVARTVEVLKMPTVGALVLIYFMAIFAFAQFEATLARITKAAFGMTDDDNFLVFAFVGVVLMFAGGAYRPMVKKRPEEKMLRAGIGLMIIGLSMLGMVAWLIHERPPLREDVPIGFKICFYAAVSISVIGFAFTNPSVSALVSKRADPERQGEVQGVNQSFASLGRILGPFLGSVLFDVHASRTLPYLAAVCTLLVVTALLPKVATPTRAGGGS